MGPLPPPTTTTLIADTFLAHTSNPSVPAPTTTSNENGRGGRHVLVYFIPGNPGMISYYHLFLSLLLDNLGRVQQGNEQEQLQSPSSETDIGLAHTRHRPVLYTVYGASLGGMGVQSEDESYKTDNRHNNSGDDDNDGTKIWTLAEQIQRADARLKTVALANGCNEAVVIGHSLGAYMAMELLKRDRQKKQELEKGEGDHPSGKNGNRARVAITGGILLFPAVMELRGSPSGRKLNVSMHARLHPPRCQLSTHLLTHVDLHSSQTLAAIPSLPTIVQTAATALTTIVPTGLLRALVRLVMGHPRDEAVNSTLALLSSPRGVRQMISLALEELRDIDEDKWGDDVWGLLPPLGPSSGEAPEARERNHLKLRLYFGRNDHWVADSTRDGIIRRKTAAMQRLGLEEGHGLKMVVCNDEIAHSFCINHSDIMAAKTAAFIREIVES